MSHARLDEVISKGAPAQVAEARRLLEQMRRDPDDAALRAAVEGLIDAYLHDPHLTREERRPPAAQ